MRGDRQNNFIIWQPEPLENLHRTFWQRLQEGAAVGSGHNTIVQDDDDAAVALCPDQAAYTLSEFQDSFRQRIFSERITPALLNQFEFRFYQWRIRHSKRKTCNNHIRKGLAGDIDAHPKTVGTKKDTARGGLKLIKKFSARRAAALQQQIEFLFRKELRHSLGHLLHAPITCEKNERTTVGLLYKMRDPMFERFFILSLPWIGHFFHDEHPHLFLEIERTAKQRRLSIIRADSPPEISEIRATH